MAYNYAREKRKFDAEWKQKALWYRKEGMSEADIEAMYRFDLEQFNRDRAYENRRSPLEDSCGSFCVRQPTSAAERYGWVNEISDPRLAEKLHGLTEHELELLTLTAIEGKTHSEIADNFSCSRQLVTKQIAQIRKIFKKE